LLWFWFTKPIKNCDQEKSFHLVQSYKMVTMKIWESIHFFTKLFPPHLIKYDHVTKTFHQNIKNKRSCLVFYFVYAVPWLIMSDLIVAYKLAYVPMSMNLMGIHFIMLGSFSSILTLCFVCVHTILFNKGNFFTLFNIMSKFQLKSIGKYNMSPYTV